MPRKVDPINRRQTPGVIADGNSADGIVNRERVRQIAARHGLNPDYDLQGALVDATTWLLLELDKQKQRPSRDQRTATFAKLAKGSSALFELLESMPHSLYFEITEHLPDGGWKRRLLEDLHALHQVTESLEQSEPESVLGRPRNGARENYLRTLVRIYEEGRGEKAQPPYYKELGTLYEGPTALWPLNNERGDYQGRLMEFCADCMALIPANKARTDTDESTPIPPRLFASMSALAKALQRVMAK